jgi:pyruvate kinase
MISECRRIGRPVITATEMLESMTYSPRPTRAEIADVANAVLDGTSAVMLSGETAVGKYPVKVVQMMARVCKSAETDLKFDPEPLGSHRHDSVREGIAHAACLLGRDIKASAIICVTDSGATAKVFSRYRPTQPVLACTPSAEVARELALFFGIIPVIVDEQLSVEALLERALARGKEKDLVRSGDRIVFTGNLTGRGGETNLLASVKVL